MKNKWTTILLCISICMLSYCAVKVIQIERKEAAIIAHWNKPDAPIVAPEDVSLIPTKLTIHTANGAMTYYPAPKSENEGDGLKYWFYPNDADIYAISVSLEKESEL